MTGRDGNIAFLCKIEAKRDTHEMKKKKRKKKQTNRSIRRKIWLMYKCIGWAMVKDMHGVCRTDCAVVWNYDGSNRWNLVANAIRLCIKNIFAESTCTLNH